MTSLLKKNKANFVELTPLSFLYRTKEIFPNRLAWIYGKRKATYDEFYTRCKKLAVALKNMNIKDKDVVSVMLPNVPEMLEAHFGVPMSGAILNSLNTRLEIRSIEYILKHSKSKFLIFHEDYIDLIKNLSKKLKIKLILVRDKKNIRLREIEDYQSFLNKVPISKFTNLSNYYPKNEWDAITLNYTSGTTGEPKGVLYHHRGAHLMCFNNQMVWKMGYHPTYLWTLPMFHCNGWCFPWTIVALAGTQVCINKFTGKDIMLSINKNDITHLCGAPIVLQMIIDHKKFKKNKKTINVMTAASPPPPSVLEDIEKSGFDVTHVYGLTESYGPAVICEWKPEWNKINSSSKKAVLKARQGVNYPSLNFLDVFNPKNMKPVKRDGKSLGEVFFKGNIIMKGYLNNVSANRLAFKNGWFHTGDLAVMHEDGYIELKDRSKDIIISGGENISSIEIEKIIIQHPYVKDCAVIGVPDNKWGEVPCAFIEKNNSLTADSILKFCRKYLAGFKIPKKIIFEKLPRTSTGKIQKYNLRKIAAKNHDKI
ncbi:MAG: acyl-CoA synthetase [Rickettsiales bacterium]|nr:acyl-CoA synthetase [Rickettsiales bacterium]|tara:strand:- start:717 stop:2330 length:1614 start_codon:yes stop_codon:yes gene_type:complete